MQKDGKSSLLPIDLNIENTCKSNHKEKQRRIEEATMAKGCEQPLLDYVIPMINGYRTAIVNPTIEGNRSFEIKMEMINMILQNQYSKAPNEDPNEHIANFNKICGTFQIHNIDAEAIRLRSFSFSLHDRAKQWLHTLPADSITTWDDLCSKFLAKFFPFEKTDHLRNTIHGFGQWNGELLHEAWARFKEILRKCPHHGIALPDQLQTFYYGLINSTKTLVNTAA